MQEFEQTVSYQNEIYIKRDSQVSTKLNHIKTIEVTQKGMEVWNQRCIIQLRDGCIYSTYKFIIIHILLSV